MPKFSATSIEAFFGQEATAGRAVRGARFVVNVEADDGSWCELDADDVQHAQALANNWVDVLNARGCSCRKVWPDGTLTRKPFYTNFATSTENIDYD